MKFRYLLVLAALLPLVLAFTFSSPGDNGWVTGESLAALHLNEIDTALDALQDGTGITALDPDIVTGDTVDDNALDVAAGGTGRATGTTAYGLIAAGTTATGDQQTLAAGATTELLVGGGASALPVWTTATGSGAPVRATSPTLTTPAIGAATATTASTGDDDTSVATTQFVQTEIDTVSAASSTDTAVAKFSGTSGDIQNSGVLIDASNNVTIPGTLTTGGTDVPTCLVMRNRADTGNVACDVNGTTFTCEVDTNGVCNDAT